MGGGYVSEINGRYHDVLIPASLRYPNKMLNENGKRIVFQKRLLLFGYNIQFCLLTNCIVDESPLYLLCCTTIS